jgi:hypothetical protein
MLHENAQFFVLREGKYEGPLPRAKLEEMLASGEVKRTDLAFREGLSNWMPVVAVLAARTTPPPFTSPDCTTSQQPSPSLNGSQPQSKPTADATPQISSYRVDAGRAPASSLPAPPTRKSVDWSLISPLNELRLDKLWPLPWVRWFALFALVPLLLVSLSRAGSWSSASQDFALAAYCAVLWAWGLRFVIKPERVVLWPALSAGFAVFGLWTVFMVILSRVPSLSVLNDALHSTDFARRLLPSVAFSIIKTAVLLLPFYWSIHWQRHEAQRTLLYSGLLVGVILGIRLHLLAVLADSSTTLKAALPVDISAAINPLAMIHELAFHSLLLATVGCSLAVGLRSPEHRIPLSFGVACCCALVMALNSLAPFALGGLVALALVTTAFLGLALQAAPADGVAGARSDANART